MEMKTKKVITSKLSLLLPVGRWRLDYVCMSLTHSLTHSLLQSFTILLLSVVIFMKILKVKDVAINEEDAEKRKLIP